MSIKGMTSRAEELKARLRTAATNFGVEEQNSSQQSIGSGSREVSDKVTGSANKEGGSPEKQNANQQENHNEGGQKNPPKDKQDKTY